MPYRDKTVQAAYQSEYKFTRKRRVQEFKESRPCADCGSFYPYYVMQFDHRDGSDKVLDISRMVLMSWAKIESEILKCDLVCANCHAVRTYNRSVAELVKAGVS